MKDLVIFELRFGFLMNNCIYDRLETSGDQKRRASKRLEGIHVATRWQHTFRTDGGGSTHCARTAMVAHIFAQEAADFSMLFGARVWCPIQ